MHVPSMSGPHCSPWHEFVDSFHGNILGFAHRYGSYGVSQLSQICRCLLCAAVCDRACLKVHAHLCQRGLEMNLVFLKYLFDRCVFLPSLLYILSIIMVEKHSPLLNMDVSPPSSVDYFLLNCEL